MESSEQNAATGIAPQEDAGDAVPTTLRPASKSSSISFVKDQVQDPNESIHRPVNAVSAEGAHSVPSSGDSQASSGLNAGAEVLSPARHNGMDGRQLVSPEGSGLPGPDLTCTFPLVDSTRTSMAVVESTRPSLQVGACGSITSMQVGACGSMGAPFRAPISPSASNASQAFSAFLPTNLGIPRSGSPAKSSRIRSSSPASFPEASTSAGTNQKRVTLEANEDAGMPSVDCFSSSFSSRSAPAVGCRMAASTSNAKHLAQIPAESMELLGLIVSDIVSTRLRVEMSDALGAYNASVIETLWEALRSSKMGASANPQGAPDRGSCSGTPRSRKPQHSLKGDVARPFSSDRSTRKMQSSDCTHTGHIVPAEQPVLQDRSHSSTTSNRSQLQGRSPRRANTDPEIAHLAFTDIGPPSAPVLEQRQSIQSSQSQMTLHPRTQAMSNASTENTAVNGYNRTDSKLTDRPTVTSGAPRQFAEQNQLEVMEVKDLKHRISDRLIAEACGDRRSSRSPKPSEAMGSSTLGRDSNAASHSYGLSTQGSAKTHRSGSASIHSTWATSSAKSGWGTSRPSGGPQPGESKGIRSLVKRLYSTVFRIKVQGTSELRCGSEVSMDLQNTTSSETSQKAKKGLFSRFSMLGSVRSSQEGVQSTVGELHGAHSRSSLDIDNRNSMPELGMAELRSERIDHILHTNTREFASFGNEEAEDDEREEWWSSMPRQFLQVCGILPWATAGNISLWYQWISLLLALCALAGCMEQIVSTRWQDSLGSMCYGRACLRLGLLSDASLALGALFGLLSFGAHLGSRFLVECHMMLVSYAGRNGFLDRWSGVVKRDLAVSLVILVLAVIERIRTCRVLHSAIDGSLDVWGSLQTVAFLFYSSVLLGLTLAVLLFCRNMMIMIDAFCYNLVNKSDLKGAVHEWNMLQAILRRASDAVQRCFFVLQTAALCFVFSAVADVVLLRRKDVSTEDAGNFGSLVQTLIPGLLVTGGVARIFFCAAAVTDKCFHVPSLVNSLSYGEEIDPDRQYVVQYVMHSGAGFYVFEVRLTSALALKFMYFCGAAAFTVATTVMTGT